MAIPSNALILLFCLASQVASAGAGDAAAPAGKKKRGDDDSKKVPLPHHSFITPLEYGSLLDDWVVSGASLFERDRLLMHPGVAGLAGFAWSKWHLLTNDFEVIIRFRVKGETDAGKIPHDQSFSFWYIQENITAAYNETNMIKAKTWEEGLREHGMTFAGSKARFDGFGAVLTTGAGDAGGHRKPAVSFISNDGTKDLSLWKDVPTAAAKEIDFRNTLNAAQVKIRVKPNSIEGHLKQSPSLAWNECFKIDVPDKVKTGGYIGFTALSGTSAAPDLVSLEGVEVNNFDDTSLGEDMKDVSAQIQDAYREMLTDENRHFLDQKSQTEHLDRLVTMLQEFSNTSQPADAKLYQQVQALTGRVDKLGEECRTLKQEAHLFIGKDHHDAAAAHKAGVEAMKDEIIGLRRLLVKDSATARQKLDAVKKNIAEVKIKHASSGQGSEHLLTIAKQTETLEKTVVSRGSQMSVMMFFMLAAVVSIGGLMWNRMQYYEKKHFI